MFTKNEIVSTYTREQAIDDGILIDIPLNDMAIEAGIRYHCAMTSALYDNLRQLSLDNKL